jgi:hypothetical protein
MTNKPLTDTQLTPNVALRKLIGDHREEFWTKFAAAGATKTKAGKAGKAKRSRRR